MSVSFQYEDTEPTDPGDIDVTQTDTHTPVRIGTIVAPVGHAPDPEIDSIELRRWMLDQALRKPFVIDAFWAGNQLQVEMYLQPESLRTQSVIGAPKPIRIDRIITALQEVKAFEAEDPSDSGIGSSRKK